MAQMLPFLLAFLILLCPVLLQNIPYTYSKDTPEHWQSKGYTMAKWPTQYLDPYKQAYTEDELQDYYCVNHHWALKDNTAGLIIDEKKIYLQHTGWRNQLTMLQFLIKLGNPIVEGRRFVTHGYEGKLWGFNYHDVKEECALDDIVEQDRIRNTDVQMKVIPVCKQKSGTLNTRVIESTGKLDPGTKEGDFTFECSAAEGQREFWQPKSLPSTFPAWKTRGILAIGYVLPYPYKCEANREEYFYYWKREDYQMLVHKDDIKNMKHVTRCLQQAYPEDPIPTTTTMTTLTTLTTPTTSIPTTTLEPTTTSETPDTTTTPSANTTMTMSSTAAGKTKIPGRRTQWRFGTRKWMMGFMDKITPFPPGAVAKIGD